jgi:epsilon-lactone hydrolase
VVEVCVRRLLKGPRRPGWSWLFELGTGILKRRMIAVFELGDVNESRRYLDSVLIGLPEMAEVKITPVVQEKVRGSWFIGNNAEAGVTVLYLHGGGYSFYPKAYATFIALITRAAKSRTFALDYSLTPEHRFPAQLEEALNAYRWLLENGTDPSDVVIAGDSAGGNLTLALLLAVRDLNLPLPALAVALSPPTDFESEGASIVGNQDFDWIEKRMLMRWADWFCEAGQRRNPLISPVCADLPGLPPIYVQAGRAEILYDSIQAFADHARSQGADVVLESWEDMHHDFQIFGPYTSQSAEALQRIGEVIDARVRGRKKTKTIST